MLYAHRCTYLNYMRKLFDDKIMHVHENINDAVGEVRATAYKIGQAAESQAELNIALTGLCVCALLVACFLVRSERTEGLR